MEQGKMGRHHEGRGFRGKPTCTSGTKNLSVQLRKTIRSFSISENLQAWKSTGSALVERWQLSQAPADRPSTRPARPLDSSGLP